MCIHILRYVTMHNILYGQVPTSNAISVKRNVLMNLHTYTHFYYIQLILIEINITLVNFNSRISQMVGWNSSVGTATHYGMDGPGIESQ